jgi:hypothetical protein
MNEELEMAQPLVANLPKLATKQVQDAHPTA